MARAATVTQHLAARNWIDSNSSPSLLRWRSLLLSSLDGQRLATTSYDGTAKVWDTLTWQELLTLRGHACTVYGVAFSPDGKRLLGGDRYTAAGNGEKQIPRSPGATS